MSKYAAMSSRTSSAARILWSSSSSAPGMSTNYVCVEWQQAFHISCIHNKQRIGRARGHFVDRERIRSRFMEHMFMQGGVLKDLATWIFDRHGRLRGEYKGELVWPIPNSWGRELDCGSFLVIESVYVQPDWRRNGLARTMIDVMIKRLLRVRGRILLSRCSSFQVVLKRRLASSWSEGQSLEGIKLTLALIKRPRISSR